ncbi:MAG: hypothetical protein V3T76_01070 [candidate division NC10 bacterium]
MIFPQMSEYVYQTTTTLYIEGTGFSTIVPFGAWQSLIYVVVRGNTLLPCSEVFAVQDSLGIEHFSTDCQRPGELSQFNEKCGWGLLNFVLIIFWFKSIFFFLFFHHIHVDTTPPLTTEVYVNATFIVTTTEGTTGMSVLVVHFFIVAKIAQKDCSVHFSILDL